MEAINDTTNVRVLADLGNNKIYGKYTDPYGFIKINFDKGQMPGHLKEAQFTTWLHAQRAVDEYLRNKKI